MSTVPKGFRLQVLQMLQGVQTVLPQGSAVSTSSGNLTQASMVSQLQSIMQAYQAVGDEGVALKEARLSIKTNQPGWREEYGQMKAAITTFFGPSSPQLVKFGLKPKSAPKPLTTAQKMARNARSAQTRKIRGTLGSVQKKAKKFTGSVTVSADTGTGASSTPSSNPPLASSSQLMAAASGSLPATSTSGTQAVAQAAAPAAEAGATAAPAQTGSGQSDAPAKAAVDGPAAGPVVAPVVSPSPIAVAVPLAAAPVAPAPAPAPVPAGTGAPLSKG